MRAHVLPVRVLSLLVLGCLVSGDPTWARDVLVHCGEIVAGEFNEKGQHDEYYIELKAGEVLDLTVEAKGDSLKTRVGFFDPLGNAIIWQEGWNEFLNAQSIKTPAVSANSRHRIVVMNYPKRHYEDSSIAGEYNLHLTCLHADGSETVAGTQAGSVAPVPSTTITRQEVAGAIATGVAQPDSKVGRYVQDVNNIAQDVTEIAEGAGAVANAIWQVRSMFQGRRGGRAARRQQAAEQQAAQQAPSQQQYAQPQQRVATAQVAPTPAAPAPTPSPGATSQADQLLPGGYQFQTLNSQFGQLIPPQGAGTTGFFFQAEQGTTVELSVSRATGNLNLGVAVLDTTGTVIFQGILMESMPQLAVPVTLPTNGQYLVRIQRNEMIPVAQPAATGFNVEVTRQEP